MRELRCGGAPLKHKAPTVSGRGFGVIERDGALRPVYWRNR
jgi:hypothetical protein